MTGIITNRPHSGDPMSLLSSAGASRSAEVLLVRPKPIRPIASESDSARSTFDAQRQRSTADHCHSNSTRSRPLGAFTLVMPIATSSMYERELCTLLKHTGLASDPAVQFADQRAALSTSRIVRRSCTPNQSQCSFNFNASTVRRPCSACYYESQSATSGATYQPSDTSAQRCPLSDLIPVGIARSGSARSNTYAQINRHHSEPPVAAGLNSLSTCSSATFTDYSSGTRKRRRKETDENASEARTGEAHHSDWLDSPLHESGDDEAIDGDMSASPTRADSKCRRRIVAASLRPSINAEKMLIASNADQPICRVEIQRNDQYSVLTKRGSDTQRCSPSLIRSAAPFCDRLLAMHSSFSMTDNLLACSFVQTRTARPASDEIVDDQQKADFFAAETVKMKAQSESNVDDLQSDECDASTSSFGKSTELPTFAPHGTTQFRIISELDIDQIENN